MTTPSGPPTGPDDDIGVPSSAAEAPPLEAEAVSALQLALGADHAAVWVYGLLVARMPTDLRSALGTDLAAHRASRDAVERTLTAAGIDPVPAEPAYRLPEQPADRAAGARLAATVEHDSAAAWYAVLGFSDDGDPIRRTALDGLTGAAVRAARWRAEAGDSPATTAFPGRPA